MLSLLLQIRKKPKTKVIDLIGRDDQLLGYDITHKMFTYRSRQTPLVSGLKYKNVLHFQLFYLQI